MLCKILGATLLVFLLWSNEVSAANEPVDKDPQNPDSGNHPVGFQLFEDLDASRIISAGTSDPKAFARPIRTYLWYPAMGSDAAQTMSFGHYVELADEDVWPREIAGNLRSELKHSAKVLARSLGEERYKQLLQQPANAIEAAQSLEGPFSLIVIGQGLYYESPVTFAALAEYLASRGFVVATCPLVGTNSPIVRMDVTDLETQVRDLEFVIARARQLPYVSPDKLGVFGFDMGGMAGLILTMRNADVDAFVSVSSGILYENLETIPSNSPHYDPLALRVPWLHSVPVYWLQPKDSRVNSLFDTARHADRYLLLTKDLGHVDYTSYALIPGRSAMSGYWEKSNPGIAVEHNTVNLYISRFFAAFLNNDPEGMAFLSREPKEVVPSSTVTLQHRSAEPVLISYEEFVQAIIAGEAEQAIEKIRSLSTVAPNHMLLEETYLERLVWSLRDTWGFNDRVMPVIRLRAELFPDSVGAQHMLADGYFNIGDHASAKQIFKRLLEQNPEDQYSKSRLESLLSQ